MTEQEEIEGVRRMIAYYCKKKHKTDGKNMCPECQALAEYVAERRHACPFGDDKPFCANCKIHCYKPEMREKIRAVMRYAAPRVTFIHPIMSFKHLSETIKTNRKKKKEAKAKARGEVIDHSAEIKELQAKIKAKKAQLAQEEAAKQETKMSKLDSSEEARNNESDNK